MILEQLGVCLGIDYIHKTLQIVLLIFTALASSYIAYLMYKVKEREENRIALEKAIIPFYDYICILFHFIHLSKEDSKQNGEDEEYHHIDGFKIDEERFITLLNKLHVYLKNDDRQEIYKYYDRLEPFLQRKIDFVEAIKNDYSFESLTLEEEHCLFIELLSEIKNIQEKYSS